jgi:hypothetical protein
MFISHTLQMIYFGNTDAIGIHRTNHSMSNMKIGAQYNDNLSF